MRASTSRLPAIVAALLASPALVLFTVVPASAAPTAPSASDRGATPLVIAHRGASASRAEHTLEAYSLAIAEGADGVECDVRLTRDQHLVCLHDRTLKRTSNGTGRVSAFTLAEDVFGWRTTERRERS